MSSQSQKPILAISLKLYFSPNQTLRYLETLASLTTRSTTSSRLSSSDLPLRFIFIPDFLTLSNCSTSFTTPTSGIHYAAQDGHWEDQGPWTGEVSMRSLREVGCEYVELGHAERRKHFGETDEIVVKKCCAAIRNGLVPIICIGEPTETDTTSAIKVLESQLDAVLRSTSVEDELVLAYEPVWAIGQPVAAPVAHIVAMGHALRRLIGHSGRGGGQVKVMYGGSAGPGMWAQIRGAVDGLFLGRFAHEIGNVKLIMGEMEAGLKEDEREQRAMG
ncbi:MAG: hypothetical protein TREMPRED_004468 [Tremellales sp. Tagirdzhanova-0007]|nr:MAG: hypothetical protein TREMPRED_004468 [Tremellales sp. Tagirdzhanova-0007]